MGERKGGGLKGGEREEKEGREEDDKVRKGLEMKVVIIKTFCDNGKEKKEKREKRDMEKEK